MKIHRKLWKGAALVCGAATLCSCREERKASTSPLPAAPVYVLDESRSGFSGANAYVHTEAIVALGARTPGSEGYEKQLKYLEKYLSAYGWKTERQAFQADTPVGKKNFTNLRARFGDGADFVSPAEGIVSGHIDTKVFDFSFVGANDGASHTAVLLELARGARRQSALFEGVEMVFFDGEEAFGAHMDGVTDGLFGSSYYVRTWKKAPLWMVNVDMVGARNLKIRIPADTPQGLYTLYRRTVAERQETEDAFGVAEGIILDDHVPFQERGVPAINLIGEFQEDGWWHTPKDTMALIGASSLERSGGFLEAFLKNLQEEVRRQSVNSPPERRK